MERSVLGSTALEEPMFERRDPIPAACPYCRRQVTDLRAHLYASFPRDTDDQIEAMVWQYQRSQFEHTKPDAQTPVPRLFTGRGAYSRQIAFIVNDLKTRRL